MPYTRVAQENRVIAVTYETISNAGMPNRNIVPLLVRRPRRMRFRCISIYRAFAGYVYCLCARVYAVYTCVSGTDKNAPRPLFA